MAFPHQGDGYHRAMTTNEHRALAAVLRDLTFPAHRWEIITQAGLYGADAALCRRLRELSANKPYRDIAEVNAALATIPGRQLLLARDSRVDR